MIVCKNYIKDMKLGETNTMPISTHLLQRPSTDELHLRHCKIGKEKIPNILVYWFRV